MNKYLRLAVSGLILGAFALRLDWAQLAELARSMRPAWWVAAVAVLGLTQLVSAVRWRMMAVPLGFDQPTRRFAAFYFIGMYFNLLLPTTVGGDVVRAWYLDGGSKRKSASALSVLADRGSGLVFLMLLAAAATAVCADALPGWLVAVVIGLSVGAVLSLVVAAALAKTIRRTWKNPTNRWTRLAITFANAAAIYRRRPGLVLSTSLLSLLVQSANVVLVWFLAKAIRIDVSLAYLAVVVPLVSLLTMIPVSVNGMGLREAGVTMLLAPVGVATGPAVGLAFLWFTVTVTVSLTGGAVYLFGRFPPPKPAAESPPESRRAA